MMIITKYKYTCSKHGVVENTISSTIEGNCGIWCGVCCVEMIAKNCEPLAVEVEE